MKYVFINKVVLLLVLFNIFTSVVSVNAEDEQLYYLWSESCPVCETSSKFLDELEEETTLTIERVEISNDRDRFIELINEYDITSQSVPIFIYKGEVWQGFNEVVERSLNNRLLGESRDENISFSEGGTCSENNENEDCSFSLDETDENVELFGWDLSNYSLFFTTMLIGIVDGFNPCSLWALMFLISMIIRFKSRKLMFVVGGTYILTVSFIYGLFILGTFAVVIQIIDYFWVRFLLFSLAAFFASVNIRDALGKENKKMTFSISTGHKKAFIQKVRDKLFSTERLSGFIIASILIGFFASMIELPCTAGFPIIWNGIVSSQSIAFQSYLGYLFIYLFMYVLVEITIVTVMVVTMRKAFIQEEAGRTLKFISGALMAFLAVVLLLGKTYMNDMTIVLGGSIIIILLSFLIIKINKKWK
ncbi:hypothetical protein [Salipaludibacillus daqingensis]|uniref:hypothetical protein n=1 Tax=Salipaludibacillus daqingensis TaxID=3041001 RepID=UPI00247617F3|nr:hypothetical protein [Salipaludibacillus daqingensis]